MIKEKKYNNRKRMTVQVVLGNPRIGCDGYGICKFITKTDNTNLTNLDRLLDVCIFIENGQLNLIFDKAKMNQTIYETHFSEGVFRIETETILPDSIISFFKCLPYLKDCSRAVLEKGVYEIIEKKVNIFIKIRINVFEDSKLVSQSN